MSCPVTASAVERVSQCPWASTSLLKATVCGASFLKLPCLLVCTSRVSIVQFPEFSLRLKKNYKQHSWTFEMGNISQSSEVFFSSLIAFLLVIRWNRLNGTKSKASILRRSLTWPKFMGILYSGGTLAFLHSFVYLYVGHLP